MSTSKHTINLLLVLLLSLAGICQGQEITKTSQPTNVKTLPVIKYLRYGFDLLDIRPGIEGKISVELSAIVQSKYMWHGLDLLDDHGVFLPVATISVSNTGLSGKIIGAYPLSSGLVRSTELDFGVFYSGDIWKDTPWVTSFTTNYFYYGKPKVSRARSDAQEIGTAFSWPKLLGNIGLSPNYYFGRLWPTRSQSNLEGCEGFIHVFGLGYDLVIPDFRGTGKNQTFKLSGDITYNDGFGGVEHDWSHVVFGAGTCFENNRISITPYVNYQISMDDSVNEENEIWCGLNSTYRF
jgi:hypothetical protein